MPEPEGDAAPTVNEHNMLDNITSTQSKETTFFTLPSPLQKLIIFFLKPLFFAFS